MLRRAGATRERFSLLAWRTRGPSLDPCSPRSSRWRRPRREPRVSSPPRSLGRRPVRGRHRRGAPARRAGCLRPQPSTAAPARRRPVEGRGAVAIQARTHCSNGTVMMPAQVAMRISPMSFPGPASALAGRPAEATRRARPVSPSGDWENAVSAEPIHGPCRTLVPSAQLPDGFQVERRLPWVEPWQARATDAAAPRA